MEHQDVADQHRPDHVDRFTAPRTDPDDPGPVHRATARDTAQIVLAAAAGESNAQIARLGICEDTVRKWRRRWCAAPGAASLADAKRSGRRPTFTAVQVARVKAMACTPPRDKGLPLSRWSWWIFITDPDFAVKAQRVLDLYDRTWDGEPLGAGDYVISADEKTTIQARCRCHPTLPAGNARQIRVNHEYHRRGAVAYLAAYDVHRGTVFGRCENTTGIAAFTNLVAQVMTREPYASADRVSWTTGPPTADRPRSPDSPSNTPTRSWCTPRCTRPG